MEGRGQDRASCAPLQARAWGKGQGCWAEQIAGQAHLSSVVHSMNTLARCPQMTAWREQGLVREAGLGCINQHFLPSSSLSQNQPDGAPEPLGLCLQPQHGVCQQKLLFPLG